MRLEANGYSPGTAYDFDRAVMSLARVIENRRDETVDKVVSAQKSPPKGSTIIQVPKFTMMELLFDTEDMGIDQTLPSSEALSHLPTALL
ncbi:MAG: hypothetical protein ACR2OE_09515 [Thermomicrobiales bacterium]